MTLRQKLALAVAAFVVLGVGTSAVVLVELSRKLEAIARQETATAIRTLEAHLIDQQGRIDDEGSWDVLTRHREAILPAYAGHTWLRVATLGPQGPDSADVATDERLRALPLPLGIGDGGSTPLGGARQSEAGPIALTRTTLPSGERVLLATMRLSVGRERFWEHPVPPLVVQAAYPLGEHERYLAGVGLLQALLLLGVVLGSRWAYRVGQQELERVGAMAASVREMDDRKLFERFAVADPPKDELDQLGATFNQLFARVETAMNAQKRFVSDASHELKNPLGAINSHLQLIALLGPSRPEAVPGWAAIAQEELQRLVRLINDMLEVARLGEDRAPMPRAWVDLGAMAIELADFYAPSAPRVSARATPGVAWVLGDADRLRQVLHNLVGNAIRATQGGGEVTIEVAPDGDRVRLSVIDTGFGMSPEVQARVFDRFYRAERTPDGTGLGLSIVRQLVEQHDGTIELVSAPGSGTAFHLSFRRAVAAPAAG